MAGTYIGAWRLAAKRAGLTLESYLARLDAGDRWCSACVTFHPVAAFGIDVDRKSGRTHICREARNRRQRDWYAAKNSLDSGSR